MSSQGTTYDSSSNGKRRRRNKKKKGGDEGAADAIASSQHALPPSQQPSIRPEMMPFVDAAKPHGFSAEEAISMVDKLFVSGADDWNDPKAVVAALVSAKAQAAAVTEDTTAASTPAPASAPALTQPTAPSAAVATKVAPSRAIGASSAPAPAPAAAPAASQPLAEAEAASAPAADRGAQLRKIAAMGNLQEVVKALAAWRRRAAPAQVDAFFRSQACTVLLGNVLQQLPGTDLDTPLRRLLTALLSPDATSKGTQAACTEAAGALVAAVRSCISQLHAAAAGDDSAAFRTALAQAVAGIATRFAAAATAFRQRMRGAAGAAGEGDETEAAAAAASADLASLKHEAKSLVAMGAVPASYGSPIGSNGAALSGTTSEELRLLVAQREASVALLDACLDRLAIAGAPGAASAPTSIAAGEHSVAEFEKAVQGLSKGASGGAGDDADEAQARIAALREQVQGELAPLVERDSELRQELQTLTSQRDALMAQLEGLNERIRSTAAERAANAAKRDSVASRHKGVAVDLDKQFKSLQAAAARVHAPRDLAAAASALEEQLTAAATSVVSTPAGEAPAGSAEAARASLLKAAAAHLSVEASVITRLEARATSAASEVTKLQAEADTYRRMNMQNVLEGVLSKQATLKQHAAEDKASCAALREQAEAVVADIAAQLKDSVHGGSAPLTAAETGYLASVHSMAAAAGLKSVSALPAVSSDAQPAPSPSAVAPAPASPVHQPAATPEATEEQDAAQRVRKQRSPAGVAGATAAPRGFGRGAARAAAPAPAAAAPAKAAGWAAPSGGWGGKSNKSKGKSFAQIRAEADAASPAAEGGAAASE